MADDWLQEASKSLKGDVSATPELPQEDNWLSTASEFYRGRKKRVLDSTVGNAVWGNPEQFAKIREASKTVNTPWQFGERKPQEIEAEAKKRDLLEKIKDTEYVKKAFEDPEFANLAHDDAENLSLLEETIVRGFRAAKTVQRTKQAVKAAPWQAGASASGTFAQGFALLSDYVGQPAVENRLLPEDPFGRGAEYWLDVRKAAKGKAEEIRGDLTGVGVTERAAIQGIESAATMVPGLLASVITGSPAPMLAWATTNTFGESTGEALEKGISSEKSLLLGTADATVEYATEVMPALKLLGDLKVGSSYFKTLLNQMLIEGYQEQIATALQDLNQWAIVNPERPFSEYIDNRGSAAYQTLIATITGTGAQTTAGYAAAKAFGTYGNDQSRAMDAGRFKANLDKLSTIDSKLAERAPDKFDEIVREMLGEDGDLYVDAREFTEYFQGQEEKLDLAEYQEDLAEAIAVGGDIKISAADYLTKFKDHHEGLSEIVRAQPEAMSSKEAQEWQETQNEQLMAEAEKIDQAQADNAEFQVSADKVYQGIKSQLSTRFSADVADKYAALHRAVAVTMADRMNITPEEVYRRRGLEIGRVGGGMEQGPVYPMAPSGEWYSDSDYQKKGGRIISMSPDEFLSIVKPLEIDESSRDNIDDLKEHIKSGRTLDPLTINKELRAGHDGRHRAYAAKELGISSVPVLVYGDQSLDQLKIKDQVEVAETGEVFTIEQTGQEALEQIDQRLENLRNLIDCVAA